MLGTCRFGGLAAGTPCVHCGWQLPRDYDSAPVRRCPESLVPCRHSGQESRAVKVRLCRGRKFKRTALVCDVHGECVPLSPAPEGLACCEQCRDYEPDRAGG